MNNGAYATKASTLTLTLMMNAFQLFYLDVRKVNTTQIGTKKKQRYASHVTMPTVLTVMMQLMNLKIRKRELVNAMNVEQE